MENPQGSALWWQYVFRRIIEHPQVVWEYFGHVCLWNERILMVTTIISPLLF